MLDFEIRDAARLRRDPVNDGLLFAAVLTTRNVGHHPSVAVAFRAGFGSVRRPRSDQRGTGQDSPHIPIAGEFRRRRRALRPPMPMVVLMNFK
ncbi:MAG TPA: hypothetical protein VM325_19460 [Alphaproteobacteria bacterium]|nr:hypothetical protein [Alphaproteobacteria bacterium]